MFHSVEFKSLIENNDFDSGGSEYNIIGDVYNGRVWQWPPFDVVIGVTSIHARALNAKEQNISATLPLEGI